jgi:hypothetical protein
MVIETRNNTYTFKDMGDGAFLMTSTNEVYPGPWLSNFVVKPEVGECALIVPLEGVKKGRVIITSKIVSVEGANRGA